MVTSFPIRNIRRNQMAVKEKEGRETLTTSLLVLVVAMLPEHSTTLHEPEGHYSR
jgi:hypothetical protein